MESRMRIPAVPMPASGAGPAEPAAAFNYRDLLSFLIAGRFRRPRSLGVCGSGLSNSNRQRDERNLSNVRTETPGENAMEVIVLQPIVALIAGILILIMPHLLNYIVAIYLIVIGLVGLLNHLA
jgi:hypothetical protein